MRAAERPCRSRSTRCPPTFSSEGHQARWIGCTWPAAGARKVPIGGTVPREVKLILSQGPSSARIFDEANTGPGSQPVPGLGDKAMLHLAAGGDEGSIDVVEGDVWILIVTSGSAADDAAILRAPRPAPDKRSSRTTRSRT
jgi:hypothetical protein